MAEYTLAYTGDQIDKAIGNALQVSNPNLLDNWYFGNPVNQRGQTSYTGAGYGIDRWRSAANVITLKKDRYIQRTSTADYGGYFQYFEPAVWLGKTVTFSVFGEWDGITNSSKPYITVYAGDNKYLGGSIFVNGLSIISTTVTFPSVMPTSDVRFGVDIVSMDGTTIKIYAAKLELGSQQTLAHLENGVWALNEIPDYADMLARCQRYYQLYSSAEKRPSKAIDCRPTMRTDPSQGTIVIGGTTYYYNTAEL